MHDIFDPHMDDVWSHYDQIPCYTDQKNRIVLENQVDLESDMILFMQEFPRSQQAVWQGITRHSSTKISRFG